MIELPGTEVDHGTVTPGDTYPIGVFTAPEPAPDTTVQHQGDSQRAGDTGTAAGAADEPPVDQGEVRIVTIETVGDQGDGIAKVERGDVVIVPDAHRGEGVTVKIDEARENDAFASVSMETPEHAERGILAGARWERTNPACGRASLLRSWNGSQGDARPLPND